MGGGGDATNVLVDPVVAVVTKVGLDHEGYLGSTLREIAAHKAGIVKPGVPVVVDGTNDEQVLRVVEGVARDVGAGEVRIVIPPPQPPTTPTTTTITITTSELGTITTTTPLPLLGPYQRANASLAIHALSLASQTFPQITPATITAGLASTTWPGRLDTVDLSPLLLHQHPHPHPHPQKTLLDGAHNPQAASALSEFVDAHLRRGGLGRVTWVLGFTQGKHVSEILHLLLRPGDRVVAVPFGLVDGMPWVRCMPPAEIGQCAREVFGKMGRGGGQVCECASEVEGLREAVGEPGAGGVGGGVVVAGSL